MYTPILKAKEGEFKAFVDLKPGSKDNLYPVFEILKYDPSSKNHESEYLKIIKKLKKYLPEGMSIKIDFLETQDILIQGINHAAHFIETALEMGLNVIPVTKLNRTLSFQEGIKEVIQKYKLDLCLRITDDQIGGFLETNAEKFCKYFNLGCSSIDVILDYEYVTPTSISTLASGIVSRINTFPFLNQWKSFSLSSSSFPKDLSQVNRDSIEILPRNEWDLWNLVINDDSVLRKPSFSDYSIANPEMVSVDPRIMRMSASIRYSILPNKWMILKGRNTREHGFGQFHSLCEALVRREEYLGKDFSWGDKYIYECSLRNVGPGNGTTWRQVANNHHFELVVHQLSNPS